MSVLGRKQTLASLQILLPYSQPNMPAFVGPELPSARLFFILKMGLRRTKLAKFSPWI